MNVIQTVKKAGVFIPVLGGVMLMASGAHAEVDVSGITGALADITTVAGAMATLAIGALAAWALYRKLKG